MKQTLKNCNIVLYSFNCIGCGKCVRCCPKDVLKIVDNGSCRLVNVISPELCTGCRKCEHVCRYQAIKIMSST